MKSNVVELLGLPLHILNLRKLYNFQGYAKKKKKKIIQTKTTFAESQSLLPNL
jgi:hypothetical protein